MTYLFTSVLGVFLLAAGSQAPATQGFRIVVVEGEDAVNIIQQKTAVAPIVEIRDRNNLPVAGATVTFSLTGPGAAGASVSTITVATNAAGQAAAVGFTPTAAGAIQINASALVQGQALTATITQTNVMTAAQAVGAASATGASSGASGSGAATGSAAAGGGGISGTTIGIVSAAAAAAGGGALIAVKAAGGDEGKTREFAASFTMEITLVFAVCTRVERYSGRLAIELDDADAATLSGRATIEDGRATVLTATGCISGPQAGQSDPWGMNPTPASGPPSNITFNNVLSVPANGPNSSGATNTFTFEGSKSGDSIVGTLRYAIRIDNAQFGITAGSSFANVTLLPH